eukprot:COSAG02_NODE_27209_length_615_cov_0.494186_1_plen_35_part_01
MGGEGHDGIQLITGAVRVDLYTDGLAAIVRSLPAL